MREPLDHRRAHECFHMTYAHIDFAVGIGRFEGGRPAEVFLRAGKDDTQIGIMACEAAVLLSHALQHGAALDDIARALPEAEDGQPTGPIGLLINLLQQLEPME